MPGLRSGLATYVAGLGCRALLRPFPQPVHRRVLEMRISHQYRTAQNRHGDGGFRGQRAADLHLSRATAGIRPHRLRGGILGAGPGGGGGAHAVLLPPAGWCHPGLTGRTVGHQHQDQRQPGCLLSRPLVHLPAAGLDELADGPGVRDTGVLRYPVYHGAGPALGG